MVNGIVLVLVLKKEKIDILNIQKKFNLNVDISGFFFQD